ncbi:FGGY family carbohydrate kinase [Paracoccus sp. Z330]|uniref:FGGY family carbohydrate kinase n=1 Tax=Paracoccus onchidii TaxID=3017813 RepID=A0ABT4ZDB0_9RHOB|nr:FGGY family carbohydrate kinase [Paracoccus onchidii]MDB6177275.1 FGGY family carbohydrate kinase [Paracoccus onchidii]
MQDYWLGIDAGTTAIKAAVYRSDGTRVALGEVPSEVHLGDHGRAEQDMETVWLGVCQAVCAAIADIDASRIASVGIAAQGDGLWALGRDKTPVGRAILWNDTRAAENVKQLYDSNHARAISHACNTAIWPGTSGAIYQWLRQEEPDRADAIDRVFYCADWVGFRLTGELATDFSNASIPFLDFESGGYDLDALQVLGSAPLARMLNAPRRAESRLGAVSADASAETGLPEGLPVSVGTMDLSAMIVGMGMERPGETMMILGTTAVVTILTEKVEKTDHPVGATAHHANGRLLTRILAPTTGAAAFDWFCGLHPKTLGGGSAAEIAARLNALVEKVPPGANGVTFLPYLNGERAPFVAPRARGSFFGLSSSSTKADMGRAVMEGAAFSLRHCFEMENGRPDQAVRLTGGGARNRMWCQIIADVMQVPVLVSEASDHGLWGAACLGAAAAGKGDACTLAQRAEEVLRHDPDPQTASAYDAAFARYVALSDACQALWK